MKIFTFFIEPGSYTIDLIEKIHKMEHIDFIFLYNDSHAKSENGQEIVSLSQMPFFQQIKYVFHTFNRYDLIIFNGYDKWQFILLFLLNIISPKKTILAIESDTKFRKRTGLKGFLKKLYLIPIFTNKYILGFPGGTYSHKDLFRNYGMKEENIFLMPMMVNNEKFYKDGTRNDEPFTFLFVGRMIPLKQIEFLIHSFLRNFQNDTDARLKIVGGGELFEPLKSKYGHHANIEFTGPKYGSDLVREYHSSHVLVLPSDKEQWGLVVNEAMAAGLPVIASDQVGAIFDLIIGKETGMIFSLEKENDLADKMKKIYEDRLLYKLLGNNAQKLMKEHWNYNLYRSSLQKAVNRAKQLLKK